MAEPRIYSPSQTQVWLDCPVKRNLQYEGGWTTKYIGRRDLAAVIGRSVGKTINIWNNDRRDEHPQEPDYYVSTVRDLVGGDLQRELDRGRFVLDRELDLAAELPTLAGKIIKKYTENDPIPHTWKILGIEEKTGESSKARIDLGVDDGLGPTFVDYKVKLTWDSRARQREIERYHNSWQMFHYVWEYGEKFSTKIDRYYLVFLGARPTVAKPEIHLFPVDQEKLYGLWLPSAQRVWRQMQKEDEHTEDPWMPARHSDEFGQCEFYRACFDFKLDPQLMLTEYVVREKKG